MTALTRERYFHARKELISCTIWAEITAILELIDRQYSGLIDD